MNHYRAHIKRQPGLLSLLAAVLLLQFIFPLHFHLHHGDSTDVQAHDHLIDSHLLTDALAADHLADENTHELKVTPDVINKQPSDANAGFIFIVSLIVLFAVFPFTSRELWRFIRSSINLFYYYSPLPPLRAPPAV